jgi:hypothetical protein
MEQVVSVLNELHQRAVSAIRSAQQRSNGLAGGLQPLQQPASRAAHTTSSGRRVHFAAPFASLSPLGRIGANKGSDKKQKKQQQQEEEEERILISEVGR